MNNRPMLSPNTACDTPADQETDEDTPGKFWESYDINGKWIEVYAAIELVGFKDRAQALGGDVDVEYVIDCLHDALADACTVERED